MWPRLLSARTGVLAARSVAAAAGVAAVAHSAQQAQAQGAKLSQLRTQSFPLADHNHGKARIRVLKVGRADERHTVHEYTVETKLFSPVYTRVFTEQDNTGLIATDTQKNTVYVVAKRTEAATPEDFGIELARHFLKEYAILSAVEIDVSETSWVRASIDGVEHEHAFVKGSAERGTATVRLMRDAPEAPEVRSHVKSMVVLKTTQSGFENYLPDRFTLLPETKERCLATELDASWAYAPSREPIDYAAVRTRVRSELQRGLFGPAHGGVYSASLQASVYDAGCMVLTALPVVDSIAIDTPNLHYLPMKALAALGESFDDDVFLPTSEPSGMIHCTVRR
jgi:urate oxidase